MLEVIERDDAESIRDVIDFLRYRDSHRAVECGSLNECVGKCAGRIRKIQKSNKTVFA